MSAILLSPFIVANIASTQNGFLTAGLLVAGLALRARNPIAAGVMLGILTFKPQLGFLLPILLIAEGRWQAIVSAAVTAAALVCASVLLWGIGSWADYFRLVAPYQTEIMNSFGGDFPYMMGSAFGAARSYGLPAETALLVHLPFAAAGVLLITPYSVAYDFGAVATLAALRSIATDRVPTTSYLRFTCMAVAMLPIVMLPLGKAGLPLAPIILLAALALLLVSERAVTRPSPPSPATP